MNKVGGDQAQRAVFLFSTNLGIILSVSNLLFFTFSRSYEQGIFRHK